MVQCGFLYDFIVVRIDVPNQPIEDHKLLSVDAAFNNISLGVTSSRINVVEFKPKRSFEFESTPEDLKRDLSVCPLRLKVYYNSVLIGSAHVPWSECFLDRISSNMGEITHIDECDLLDEADERVGTIEYICRLQCKCEEPSEDYCPPDFRKDLKNHINRIIDPNDVLFVVAEPNKEDVCNVPINDNCETSCDTAKPTTALDLSPYRILNGRLVQNADAINTCQNYECCDLLKTSQQYQKLIDSLNPCAKKKKGSTRMCQAYQHVDECPHGNKFSTHSDSSSEVSIEFQNFGSKTRSPGSCKSPTVNVCGLDMPMPEDTVHIIKGPRICPVCKEDVRWLPKLATCPNCGYKPVPVFVEKPHNEDLTAEQILEEYLENRSSVSDQDFQLKGCEKKLECRCTCVKNKICANCRVRQLCGDILEPTQAEEETCEKFEEETNDQFKLCSTSSKDCRPHLARVFSELRDLFDSTSSKPEPQRINKKCERELNPPVENFKKRSGTSREIGGSRVSQNKTCSPCDCKTLFRKRRRYRKKPSQFGVSKAICRPPPCEREEMILNFHDACIDHRRNVPGNMGWLWNANPELGPRWRPGAIRKPVKEIMQYFLRDFPADTIPISRYSYRRNNGKGDNRAEEEEEELIQHPTLHICKKNGEIFVTLRPLKSAEALRHCANPYMDMKPITFKIVKNPLAAEVGKMKQCLKDMGFSKCTCDKPIVECFCRSFLDKKRLEYQMKKECRKRGLEDFYETMRLSDSEDSEVEYDFSVTPPAGLVKRNRVRRPDKVNVGTQYEQCDWNPPSTFPMPPNPFMKWINCATGHKYAYRRASDLLTIGQKEAILCKEKKAAEAELKKAGRFKKGKKKAKKAEAAPKAKMDKKDVMQTCPDGTKVNMRKYLEAKSKPKKK